MNFAPYIPLVAFVTFLYALLPAAPLFFLMRGGLGEELALAVSGTVGVTAAAAAIALVVRSLIRQLSQSRLQVADGSFTVKGYSSTAGLVEKQYPLDQIEVVGFGKALSQFEAAVSRTSDLVAPGLSSAAILKDLKAGVLVS